MKKDELLNILVKVKNGELDIKSAADKIVYEPIKSISHSSIDLHREVRRGFPEVVYGAGKSIEHIIEIIRIMKEKKQNVMATRVKNEYFDKLKSEFEDIIIYKDAAVVYLESNPIKKRDTYIAVVSAGTSDYRVSEEAAVCAELMGNPVKRFYDIGIAGIHRTFDKIEEIANAKVVIVVAGMEGALASVIAGLIDKPVIAVPTSVGYGASFNGIAALLGMLTSCSGGISVVNIDNGFGAAYTASLINAL